jgi:hypothetical protein
MSACPKCDYLRQVKDADPYTECPRCGIVFTKYALHHQDPVATPTAEIAQKPAESQATDDEAEGPWYLRLKDRLMELPERPDKTRLLAQAAVLAVMVVWGIRLITYRVITAEIMGSFLHSVDLPIHEFGHVLFRPFGEWMMYLGGSLFQCLLPAILGVAFIWKQRNPFAACFCLWWTAENVLDVAPYIYDAKLMALPLVGEWNDEVAEMHVLRHDWHNILAPMGLVGSAEHIGMAVHAIGATLMVLAWFWGGLWLWKAWQGSRLDGV